MKRWARSSTRSRFRKNCSIKAKEYHEQLIEAVSESDDHLFSKFVEGSAITEDELRAGIRKATIAQKIFPVVCGTAFKNKGVQNLLDAVVDYLPSPLDVPADQGRRRRR